MSRATDWFYKKRYDSAIADLDKALELDPKLVPALAQRAWIGAMCPDQKYRDGKKAVELATRANELAGGTDPQILGILSSSYYEIGDVDAAAMWRARANELTPGIMNKLFGKTLVFLMEQQTKASRGEAP
jgi:tetratricopeptide (TPR) repeat protein